MKSIKFTYAALKIPRSALATALLAQENHIATIMPVGLYARPAIPYPAEKIRMILRKAHEKQKENE